MRVDFSYPAFVHGTPSGLRRPRHVFSMLEGAVDIPELTEDEAPLACAVDWPECRERWRWRDGRFYRSVGPVADVEASGNARTVLSSVGGSMLLEMAEYLAEDKTRAAAIWPRSVPSWLGRLRGHDMGRQEVVGQCELLLQSTLPLPLAAIEDIDPSLHEEWAAKAAAIAAGVFVCGGTLWQECAEPLLFMDFRFYEVVTLGSTAAYGARATAWLNSLTPGRGPDLAVPASVGSDAFLARGMDEIPSILADIEAEMRDDQHERTFGSDSVTNIARRLSRIAVYRPDVFGATLPELELHRFALAVRDYGTVLFSGGRKRKLSSRTPPAISAAWNALAAVLADHGPEAADDIEPVLVDFMDAVTGHLATVRLVALFDIEGLLDMGGGPDAPMPAMENRDANEGHRREAAEIARRLATVLDRWRSRPIAVDAHAASIPCPGVR